MDHSYFQSRLSAYADQELPPDERAAVAEHLKDCPDCSGRLEELERLAELVAENSELDDSDYWEKAAKKIEARLGAEETAVTNLKAERKQMSGIWWKLPAIAASVLIVGYIGLHESDILKDEIMIPPAEESAQVASPPSDTIGSPDPAPPPEADRVDAEEIVEDLRADEYRPALIERPGSELEGDESAPADDRQAEVVDRAVSRSEPHEIALDQMSAGYAEPDKTELEPPAPVPAAPVARPDADEFVPVATEEIPKVKKVETAPSDLGESRRNYKRGSTAPGDDSSGRRSGGRSRSSLSDEITMTIEGEDYQPEGLDYWRGKRDSLLAEQYRMEQTESVAKSPLEGLGALTQKDAAQPLGLTKSAPSKDPVEVDLDRLEAELVGAWWRICLESEDPDEIARGRAFLRQVADNKRSGSREDAARYLQLLDQH